MEDKKNFYINGQWVSPLEPRTFQVINPANEESCAEISRQHASTENKHESRQAYNTQHKSST